MKISEMTTEEQRTYLLNQLIDMDCAIIGYRKKLAYESADGLVNELERIVKDVLASFRKAGKKEMREQKAIIEDLEKLFLDILWDRIGKGFHKRANKILAELSKPAGNEKAIELLERAIGILDTMDSMEDNPIELCCNTEALKGIIPEALALLKPAVCELCGGSGRKSIRPIITQSDFPRSAKFDYSPLPQTEPCPKGCKPATGQPEAGEFDKEELRKILAEENREQHPFIAIEIVQEALAYIDGLEAGAFNANDESMMQDDRIKELKEEKEKETKWLKKEIERLKENNNLLHEYIETHRVTHLEAENKRLTEFAEEQWLKSGSHNCFTDWLEEALKEK